MAIDTPRREGTPWRSSVSQFIERTGVFEPLYTQLWGAVTARCCAAGGLVLDVGANLGYFSLLSAHAGCRVHVWEVACTAPPV